MEVMVMTVKEAPRPHRRVSVSTPWPRQPRQGEDLCPSQVSVARPPLPAPAPQEGRRTGSEARWATGHLDLQWAPILATPRTLSPSPHWPAASQDKMESMEVTKCWESRNNTTSGLQQLFARLRTFFSVVDVFKISVIQALFDLLLKKVTEKWHELSTIWSAKRNEEDPMLHFVIALVNVETFVVIPCHKYHLSISV